VFWSCLFSVAEEKTSFLFTGRSFAEDGSIVIRRSATTNSAHFFCCPSLLKSMVRVNKKELPVEGEETV
jgi:hypothetical protein